MKQRMKSNRGVAMEMAIVMMVLVFGLTAVMCTVSLSSRQTVNEDTSDFVFKTNLDAIGEAFIASNDKANFNAEGASVYSRAPEDGGGYRLRVVQWRNDIAWTLTVEVDRDGNVLRYTNY